VVRTASAVGGQEPPCLGDLLGAVRLGGVGLREFLEHLVAAGQGHHPAGGIGRGFDLPLVGGGLGQDRLRAVLIGGRLLAAGGLLAADDLRDDLQLPTSQFPPGVGSRVFHRSAGIVEGAAAPARGLVRGARQQVAEFPGRGLGVGVADADRLQIRPLLPRLWGVGGKAVSRQLVEPVEGDLAAQRADVGGELPPGIAGEVRLHLAAGVAEVVGVSEHGENAGIVPLLGAGVGPWPRPQQEPPAGDRDRGDRGERRRQQRRRTPPRCSLLPLADGAGGRFDGGEGGGGGGRIGRRRTRGPRVIGDRRAGHLRRNGGRLDGGLQRQRRDLGKASGHDGGVGGPVGRRLGEQVVDQVVEWPGNVGHDRCDAGRPPRPLPLQHLRHRSLERRLAGEHGEHHEPEAVEIGAVIHGQPRRLLRRHVFGRADHHAGAGVARLAEELGDAEVGELHVKATAGRRRKHQVGGLEVAMHHALVVRRLQDADDFQRDHRGLLPGEPPAGGEELVERLALDELHGEERHAPLVAESHHPGDARMPEGHQRVDLRLESPPDALVVREVERQGLDGHRPARCRIDGLVDGAHAALAQEADDAIGAELGMLHGMEHQRGTRPPCPHPA